MVSQLAVVYFSSAAAANSSSTLVQQQGYNSSRSSDFRPLVVPLCTDSNISGLVLNMQYFQVHFVWARPVFCRDACTRAS